MAGTHTHRPLLLLLVSCAAVDAAISSMSFWLIIATDPLRRSNAAALGPPPPPPPFVDAVRLPKLLPWRRKCMSLATAFKAGAARMRTGKRSTRRINTTESASNPGATELAPAPARGGRERERGAGEGCGRHGIDEWCGSP
jgi:hypothetical protein